MLTSITPLGERGRGSRWGVTVAFLVAGATLAGGLTGTLFGLLGELMLDDVGSTARLLILALVIAVGIALDRGLAGLRLPTVRRQVNEDWLAAYRGWLYGLGFGLQLGTGVLTIVSTSAVYAALAAALLSASAPAGAVIGATFGLVRGLTVLPARRARSPEGLFELGSSLRRLEATGATATFIGLVAALAATVAAVAVGA